MSFPIASPHRNPEAEETLLCAILNNPQHIASYTQGMAPDVFYHVANRLLYSHLVAMGAEGVGISLPSITQRLSASSDLDKVGGASHLVHLLNVGSIPSPAGIQDCRTILKTAAMARMAQGVLQEALARSMAEGMANPLEWIMETAERLQGIGSEGTTAKHRSMKELVMAAIERYEDAAQRNGKLAGHSTGFAVLDAMTGGFCPGHLWVVGGGSSDGKSAFVQQMMLALGVFGVPCAIYTLEMSDDENVDRFFCQHGNISSASFMRGTFTNEESRAFSNSSKTLVGLNIQIRDVSGIKKTDLIADMRLIWRIHGTKVFAIDYGQLIASEGKHFSREREVADISASLKAFAKHTKSTVIFVSQLNEEGKLRESRAIGFDADKAMRIRVPATSEDDETPDDSRRVLHIDKNRGGMRFKKIEYDFHGETFRFLNERLIEQDEKPSTKTRKPYKE